MIESLMDRKLGCYLGGEMISTMTIRSDGTYTCQVNGGTNAVRIGVWAVIDGELHMRGRPSYRYQIGDGVLTMEKRNGGMVEVR